MDDETSARQPPGWRGFGRRVGGFGRDLCQGRSTGGQRQGAEDHPTAGFESSTPSRRVTKKAVPMTKAFLKAIESFLQREGLELVRFQKRERTSTTRHPPQTILQGRAWVKDRG